ncbi:MAG TPA: PAS domain S-box protein, partial [Chitinophagaceae bacterium]|nr:PAS domain S-box protein [Chitinophagaceae bacterium]
LFIINTSIKTAYILAGLVIVIGILRFSDLFFGFNLQADSFLYTDKLLKENAGIIPNRMAPVTAACFVLAGISSMMMPYEKKTGYRLSHYIVLGIAVMSLLSLLGYLYQVKSFYGFLVHISMAGPTALCFFLFSLVILFSDPGKGIMKEFTSIYSGSLMARLLIPAAFIVPSVLGFLRLLGNWSGIYSNEFGTALYALSIIIVFASITWYNAWLLNKRDILKKQTEDALRDSEQHIQAIFHNAPDAVVVMDSDGTVTKWNPEAEKIFGWEEKEARGQLLSELIIPPQFREAHKKGLRRFLSTGENNILGKTVDLWGIKKDQSAIDVSLRISPLMLNQKQFFVGFIRDITERKQIENKLKSFNEELSRQVEEKTSELTEIFERITDGFIALDKDFCYTYVNQKAGELTHRDPASLIGKNIWEEFPMIADSSTYHAFHKAMKEQQFVNNIDYYAPFDLWQSNFIYPSSNGLSIFIRDISDQKKAETEINKAKDLADKLIDSLPGVFYFFDANGKFIRWNKEFEQATGYSSEEIAGMHPTDFFSDKEKSYIAGRIEGVFLKGINDAEANFLTKSGKLIPYYFKAVMINYEGKPCLLGNGIDITERKKAESELIASEQKYKLLFERNPLPMWMLDLPLYNVHDVNNAALLQYGYTREEFLNLTVFDFRPKEDIEKFKAATNTTFRGIHHAGVWRHKKKNGTILYVDIITYDLNYKGQQTRLVLANDVTEKHIAEEKLKESYDAIRELTDYLQNVREEERLHMAREIHDELGQLLTILKMDVSWVNKRTGPDNVTTKEKLNEILSVIDTTVKAVRRIASELRPSLLDDLGLLAAMEWHLEEFERRSGISKELYIPETEIPLPDSLKIGIFRIFQESLTNVARHSEATKVVVSLVQNEKQLILTIKDNGKGFEEKEEARRTLGLLGMKERSQMMGGQYSISGIRGEGTTVTVIVPLPEADL